MSIEVTPHVFDFSKSRVGSWVEQNEELADLHEWRSGDLKYRYIVERLFETIQETNRVFGSLERITTYPK